jgi:hypothetical protein
MTKVRSERKSLPGAWLAVLAVLLEEGQAAAVQITAAQTTYCYRTLSSALSNLHSMGLVQHCGAKRWGLTKAGIEAALLAEEEEAQAVSSAVAIERRQV